MTSGLEKLAAESDAFAFEMEQEVGAVQSVEDASGWDTMANLGKCDAAKCVGQHGPRAEANRRHCQPHDGITRVDHVIKKELRQ